MKSLTSIAAGQWVLMRGPNGSEAELIHSLFENGGKELWPIV